MESNADSQSLTMLTLCRANVTKRSLGEPAPLKELAIGPRDQTKRRLDSCMPPENLQAAGVAVHCCARASGNTPVVCVTFRDSIGT